MGKVIRFPGRKEEGEKKPPQEGEAWVVLLEEDLTRIKEKTLGPKGEFTQEKDLRKVEQYFLSFLISYFREGEGRVLSYMYISRLLSTPQNLRPRYVIDVWKEAWEKRRYDFQRLGDTCLVLTGLYREWLERPRRPIGVEDYYQMGSFFYRQASTQNPGRKAFVFADLAHHFSEYAEAIWKARKQLF